MPTYDYRCEADDQLYEVKHAMSLSPKTWGELCDITGMDNKGIPKEAVVKKVLSTGGVVKSTSLKNPDMPPCMSGGCPGANACGV